KVRLNARRIAGTSCRVAGRNVLSGRDARISKNAIWSLSKASAVFVNRDSDALSPHPCGSSFGESLTLVTQRSACCHRTYEHARERWFPRRTPVERRRESPGARADPCAKVVRRCGRPPHGLHLRLASS